MSPASAATSEWVIRQIKGLAAKVPEPYREEVELLASRVQQLSGATLNDYGTFLNIVFDNQDRIRSLEERAGSLEDRVSKLTVDLADIHGKVTALIQEFDRIETPAVLRQIATNIEYELKLEFLGSCTLSQFPYVLETMLKLDLLGAAEKGNPASVGKYKYAYGATKGQWRQGDILDLRVDTAEDLAREHGTEGDVREVLDRWFTLLEGVPVGTPDAILAGRQVFTDAMRALKKYSSEGPTQPNTTMNRLRGTSQRTYLLYPTCSPGRSCFSERWNVWIYFKLSESVTPSPNFCTHPTDATFASFYMGPRAALNIYFLTPRASDTNSQHPSSCMIMFQTLKALGELYKGLVQDGVVMILEEVDYKEWAYRQFEFLKGYTPVKPSHVRLINIESLEYSVSHIDSLQEWNFLAISHVWGGGSACRNEEDGTPVWELNEEMCHSVNRALTALKHFGLRYIWMDVLCANQSVPADVGIQFTSMHAIYSKSAICAALNCPQQDAYECTCDSLGSSVENNFAARFCEIERDVKMRIEEPLKFAEMANVMMTEYVRLAPSMNGDCINSWRYALNNHMSNGSWFMRVWTFQEAVMSRQLYLQCGKNYHDWDTLLGRTLLGVFGPGVPEEWVTIGGIFSEVDRCRREYQEKGVISVATVIRMLQQRHCRFEADRLYGIAAMCGFNTSVPYDPHTRLDELWTTVRKWAIERGDANLLLLGACDLQTQGLGLTPKIWQGRPPREGMNTFTIRSHCSHGIQLSGGTTGRVLAIMEQFRTPDRPQPEGTASVDFISTFSSPAETFPSPLVRHIVYPTDPIRNFAFRMRQIILHEYLSAQSNPSTTTYTAPKRGFLERMAEKYLKVDLKLRDLCQYYWPRIMITGVTIPANTQYNSVVVTYIQKTTNKFMQAHVLVSLSIPALDPAVDYYVRMHDDFACPNGEGVLFELNPGADGHACESGSRCGMVHARAVGRCFGIVYEAEIDPGSEVAREGFSGQLSVGDGVAVG
ncbi:hypothetical protein HK097_004556 [Rhizophlyctis rosea]|uniref:Heterokaryon incompatibility domain-containing protein n=1 Tax=Rhizophlyctis rosea TaxID=64517 RepID=A0AAD5X2R4_9FUNG|nr:hypothetical protein HK097_004556 [Rhizophlyctis rosea]